MSNGERLKRVRDVSAVCEVCHSLLQASRVVQFRTLQEKDQDMRWTGSRPKNVLWMLTVIVYEGVGELDKEVTDSKLCSKYLAEAGRLSP